MLIGDLDKDLLIEIMHSFNLLEIQVENMLLDDNLIIKRNLDDIWKYANCVVLVTRCQKLVINIRPQFSHTHDREDVLKSIRWVQEWR